MTDDFQKKIIQDEIAIEKFVDDLVAARQDLWVQPENRDRFKKALMKQLKEEINLRFINLLSDEDQKLLNNMLNREMSDEEISKFMSGKIENPTAELAFVFERFREMVMVGKKENI